MGKYIDYDHGTIHDEEITKEIKRGMEMKNLLIENKEIQNKENETSNSISYHSYEYNPLGFEVKNSDLHQDCIILCYSNIDDWNMVYRCLEDKKNNQIVLRLIVTPFDEPKFKIVIEFINRNKDVYHKGVIPKNLMPDSDKEKLFLSNISKFDKIIYIGDVIRLC